MLWIIAVIIGIAGLSTLLEDNKAKAMDDFCNLECQERKIRDCSICC